jgi:hypothetical protein
MLSDCLCPPHGLLVCLGSQSIAHSRRTSVAVGIQDIEANCIALFKLMCFPPGLELLRETAEVRMAETYVL